MLECNSGLIAVLAVLSNVRSKMFGILKCPVNASASMQQIFKAISSLESWRSIINSYPKTSKRALQTLYRLQRRTYVKQIFHPSHN